MKRWTLAEVLATAPDASSVTAARKLARPGPWSQAGASDTLVWGQCQGSGRTPYQVSVDLTGPAYRCSCPSRKFPCKHALALLMLWAEGDGALTGDAPVAAFAEEWAEQRADRATRATTPREAPADPAAAAKRLERRLRLMDDGMADLALWLTDLVRGGLAAARHQPLSWWDGTAARLVDAQLPGLAEQVRTMGGRVQREDGWTDALLVGLGRWWSVVRAWERREELDEARTGDLRAVVGWAVPAEDVRAADRLADDWLVLGAFRTQDGRVAEQRTWLRGVRTGEVVQVLDFAAGGGALPVAQVTGAVLTGEVSRYPGAGFRRATFTEPPVVSGAAAGLPEGGDLAGAGDLLARTLTADPWTVRVPVVLAGARLDVAPPPAATSSSSSSSEAPPVASETVLVVDATGHRAPVLTDVDPWPLLARAGGYPVDLCGEWEDGALRLLSAAGLPGTAGVVGA